MEIADGAELKQYLDMVFNQFKNYNLRKRQNTVEEVNIEESQVPQFKTKNATLTVEING